MQFLTAEKINKRLSSYSFMKTMPFYLDFIVAFSSLAILIPMFNASAGMLLDK
jgi:hypothetical protein